MRHHDTRAPLHKRGEGVLHERFAFRIERARRLIEHEHRAIGQNGTRNGDALALAARQLHAALADLGFESLRQAFDEFQRVRTRRRFANLVHAGARLAIRDILGNAAVEQQRFLRHISDLATQRLLRALRDVLPIKKNAPLLNIGQTKQKLRERRFARAGKADEANALTCGNMQFEIVEHLRFRIAVAIRKANAFKIDRAFANLQIGRAGSVGHQARFIERGRHAARVAERAIETLQAVVDEVELVRDRIGVSEHHHKRARRDAVPRIAACDEHGHHAHNDHSNRCRDNAARKRSPHALRIARNHFPIRRIEQPALIVFAPIRFHGKDIRHRIGQLARQLVLSARRLLIKRQNALVHDI